MSKKILIVGGVAGGASTAARLRRLDETAEIIIFEKGPYISFANCGLPYYVGEVIKERESLLLQTPEAMKSRFNIDVRVLNEVVNINRDEKYIEVLNVNTNETYQESYDTLVLSTGSTPLRPRIEGIEAENIKSIWNVPDTDKIVSYIKEHNVKTATVIGGGFIGIEMAENLKELNIDVSLAEMAKQVMAPLDFEMAQFVHEHLASQGIKLYLDNGVKKFEKQADQTVVVLNDGTTIASDLVILSLGIRPNSELAKKAGLELNNRAGIVVNEYMQTSDENIYALGDVVETTDYNTKERSMTPLAGPANKQGRIVANNICGRMTKYRGAQKTSVAKIFDIAVATTGLNEKNLAAMGKKYQKDYLLAYIEPKSHAGYYPNAFPMHLKLIFDLDGKVLGAQNVGYENVEKIIDVISTTMHFNGSIYDLMELDLSYAPPFGSAKDPSNMIGFAAENILDKDQAPILVSEIKDLDLNQYELIDVRTPLERETNLIENSINIEVDNLRANLDKLDKNKIQVVYCAVGVRGYIATRILQANGFKAKNLLGGCHLYSTYVKDFSRPVCLNTSIETTPNEPIQNSNLAMEELDATGLQCPGPILALKKKIDLMEENQVVRVRVTDFGFVNDAKAWCLKTNNQYLNYSKENKVHVVDIKKGASQIASTATTNLNGSTMVVFSGDLDKAIASLIIANGATAMGKEVTMFFTFWGLNILRKNQNVKVKKPFLDAMFGKMMPQGTSKLSISKMNMGGLGTKMMKYIMRKKNVLSIDDLLKQAQANGVKMVACTMSMDILGISKEELIDNIEYGGVAAYLGATESSNHNLFI